jgi:tetratricopeptide (TPR) repeat protein
MAIWLGFNLSGAHAAVHQSNPLEVGVDFFLQGEYQEAIEEFNQLDTLTTEDSGLVHNYLCKAYLYLGNHGAALDSCGQAIALTPRNQEAYLHQGLAYYQLSQYDQAIEAYHRAINLQPTDFRGYYHQGLAYFALGDLDNALESYNQALQRCVMAYNNTKALIYSDRGLTYLALEQLPQAIEDLSLAIQLNPNDVMSYYHRACACHEHHHYEQAIADFSAVLAEHPDYTEVYMYRGLSHHQLGHNQQAIKDLKLAIEQFKHENNQRKYQEARQYLQNLQKAIINYGEVIV